VQPTNDGWDNNPINPPSGIAHWPDNPFPPPPPLQSIPHVASSASMAQSVQVPRNYKVFPNEPQIDKGKQPANSPSSETSQSSSIHSKQPSTKADNNKREITFSDMHPKIVKLEENKSYDKDLLKLRPDVSEGRKEREESLKRNIISDLF
jgi:hypothetical protein